MVLRMMLIGASIALATAAVQAADAYPEKPVRFQIRADWSAP